VHICRGLRKRKQCGALASTLCPPRLTRPRTRAAQVLWTFSIYLEAVAILPQLVCARCGLPWSHAACSALTRLHTRAR
jgi:hypothetical protein